MPRRAAGRAWRFGAAVAALLAVVVAGSWSFVVWRSPPAAPDGAARDSGWWSEPGVAWAEQAEAAFAAARGRYVTWREEILLVEADGSRQPTENVMEVFAARHAYRRDSYYASRRTGIQWYTEEGDDTVLTSLRLEERTYSVIRTPGAIDWNRSGRRHPVDWLGEIGRNKDFSTRKLGLREIDGRQCSGFEVRREAAAGPVTRLWFDVQTKLPVTVESVVSGDGERMRLMLIDDFDLDARLPPEVFTPRIPPDYREADSG